MLKKLINIGIIVSSLILMITPSGWTQEGNYRVQPEDVLQISVYEHDDLKTTARVSTNGEISFRY